MILLPPRMHYSVMRAISVQMTKRIRKKRERGNVVVVRAEVGAKVGAEVEVEAGVTVAADLRAVEKVRAIELLSKM